MIEYNKLSIDEYIDILNSVSWKIPSERLLKISLEKGINVKLAARLTHYKLDVKCLDEVNIEEYREKYSNILKEEEVSETNEENTNA